MTAEVLLERLEKVRKTGSDTWVACCPAHNDRNPSLSIRETDDKVLVVCRAGCSAPEIMSAAGLGLSDLFPPRNHHGKPEKRPFPASDALRTVSFEALVVLAAAKRITNKQPLPAGDYERLLTAAERINAALSSTGIMRGTPWAN